MFATLTTVAQTYSTVGSGTTSNGNTAFPTPLGNYYFGNREQFFVTAAELTAAGVGANSDIQSIAFNVMNVNACPSLTGFYVQVFTTSATNPLTAWHTGTPVAQTTPANYQPVVGWNQFALNAPFLWNGTDNLVVATCSNNTGWVDLGNASVQWTTTLTGATYSRWFRADAAGVCTNTGVTNTSTTNRPNIQFGWAASSACAGTPAPGNTTGPASVCSGASFSLALQNNMAGTGVSYQWHASLDGGLSYAPVGPNAASYPATQTQSTMYYCAVTCAGNTTNSTPITVDMGSACQCVTYCAANSYGSGSCIQAVSINTLTSTTTGCANTVILKPETTTLTQGATYPITVTTEATPSIVSIWFDWNNDLTFSADEWYQPYTNASTGSINVTVPHTSYEGGIRMRVRSRGTGNPNGAADGCNTGFGSGTTEDFCITIIPATACSGTPSPGNTTGPGLVCSAANFTLGLQNTPTTSGNTYQWQYDNGGGWTDFGTSAPNQTVSQTMPTSYQCIVTCDGNPATSAPLAIGMESFLNCYCTSGAGPTSTGDSQVASVVLTGGTSSINMTTGCPPLNLGVEDYSAQQADIAIGVPYTVSVTFSSCSGNYYDGAGQVWIDYDHSGTFDADEAIGAALFLGDDQPYVANMNFTVPADALEGLTGMRVTQWEGGDSPISNACDGFTWGSVMDFTVEILPGTLCLGIPDAGTVTGPGQVASGSTFTLGLSGTFNTTGLSFQWKQSTSGPTGPWTNVGSNLSNLTLSVVENSWFYCEVTCSEEPTLGNSNVHAVTPIPVVLVPMTGSNVNACGNNIYLQDNGGSGDYSNNADGYTVLEAGLDATITISGQYVGEGCCDHLYIYSGAGTGGAILLDQVGSSTIAYTGEPGETLTIRFTSDVSAVFAGFNLSVSYSGVCYEPCAAMPDPGATTGPPSPSCPGLHTFGLENPQLFEGISYQWESADDENFTLNVTTLGTGSTELEDVTSDKWFRCLVTCTNTSDAVYSTPLFLDVEGTVAECADYCIPSMTNGCTDLDIIGKVELNTLVNESGLECPSGILGYSNYTNSSGNPNWTTTLQAGNTYQCLVTTGEWAGNYAVWIDYNDDGAFETPAERIGFTTAAATGSGNGSGVLGATVAFPVTVACDPPLGSHRMRVREQFNMAGSAITPCDDGDFGEIEDYIITISAPDPCPAPSALNAVLTQTTYSGVLSWNAGCTETEWDVHVQAAGGGVPVTPSNPGLTATNLPVSGYATGNYEFYVRAVCDVSLSSTWSGPYVFSFIPDDCVNAMSVPVLTFGSCPANGTPGSSVGATPSGLATPSCMISGLWDVFYTFNSGTNTSVQWNLTLGTLQSYGIQVLEDGCAGTEIYCSADVTSGDLPVVPNTDYIFRLLGVVGFEGTYSLCISTPPAPACASTPNPLNGGQACATSAVELSWAPTQFAGEYDVYLDGSLVATVATTSYDAGVLSSGSHTWSVEPKNSSGAASGCPEWSFEMVNTGCICNTFCVTDNFGDGALITNVTLNTLNNSTAPGTGTTSAPAYSLQAASTELMLGVPYTLSVSVDNVVYGAGIVSVWFDWDANGTFDVDE